MNLFIGAANRDPAQFPEPDRLGINRQENRHLACGFGLQFCLAGSNLDPADDALVLRNIHGSLRPGGSLVLETIGKEVLRRIFSRTCASSSDQIPLTWP